jgi:hypothetical protein
MIKFMEVSFIKQIKGTAQILAGADVFIKQINKSHMFGHSKKRKKELMDKLNIIEELEESDPLSPKGLSKHGLLPENC